MKKLLLLILLNATFVQAQVLATEDFNSLTTGNVSTNITGTTAGQGNWLLFSTNGNAPTTSTNASVNNAQIVSSSLQLTGPNGDKGASFLWQDGLGTVWGSRTAGKNIIEVEVDVTRGANSASLNIFGTYIYDSTLTKILAGFTINASTGEINLLAYSTPAGSAIGNYSYSLSVAPGIIFPANSTARMGVSFNLTTGQVRIKGPGIAALGLTLTGSAAGTNPFEIDFIASSGTITTATNTSSTTMLFDNLISRATATDTLLATQKIDDNSNKFTISPNPTHDIINISNTDNFTINEVTITDLNGRVVLTSKYDNVVNPQINIIGLSNGVYLMNIKSEQGTATKKIIKN